MPPTLTCQVQIAHSRDNALHSTADQEASCGCTGSTDRAVIHDRAPAGQNSAPWAAFVRLLHGGVTIKFVEGNRFAISWVSSQRSTAASRSSYSGGAGLPGSILPIASSRRAASRYSSMFFRNSFLTEQPRRGADFQRQ